MWDRVRRRDVAAPDSGSPEGTPAVTAWLESGLVDRDYYAALRGRAFPDDLAAARDLVRHGMPDRLSPHPLVDFVSLPLGIRTHWRERRARKVVDFLLEEGVDGGYGPLAEVADRAAARTHMLEVAQALAAEPVRAPDAGPLTVAEVAEAQAERLDWARLAVGLGDRVPGRTSVVIPTYGDARMTVRAVHQVRRRAAEAGDDVEVVVVDNGCDRPLALGLAAAAYGLADVALVRLPANLNFAAASNIGLARSTGDVVVFLNNDTEVRRGWLAPLRSGLEDPRVAGVQPLLLYDDDTIQTAGTVFLDGGLLPCHFLVGHPRADALRVVGERFAAVTAAALACRAEDVVVVNGFDTGYRNGFEDVDLCLRLLEVRPGGFRVAPTALVTHFESRTPGRYAHVDDNRRLFLERWRARLPAPDPGVYARVGFELAEVGSDDRPQPVAQPRLGARVRAHDDQLRWSISLPSTAGHWGDDWGDTHLAESLARALRDCGEDVVTRRRDAHETGPTHLDDVHLAIRGRFPVRPHPGKINVLWVISHPDSFRGAEVEGYDVLCAASPTWAEELARTTGRPVLTLLQATEVTESVGRRPRRPEALFVGSSFPDRDRPIVREALDAKIPLAVHGRGWDSLPDGVWRSAYVANDQLPELYAEHVLVLADHWPDMARHGFVANRVFDAVAAGAHVASDPVAGIDALFGPEVRVVSDRHELRAAFDAAVAEGEVRSAADGVRREHSFRARAQVLVEAVRQRGTPA